MIYWCVWWVYHHFFKFKIYLFINFLFYSTKKKKTIALWKPNLQIVFGLYNTISLFCPNSTLWNSLFSSKCWSTRKYMFRYLKSKQKQKNKNNETNQSIKIFKVSIVTSIKLWKYKKNRINGQLYIILGLFFFRFKACWENQILIVLSIHMLQHCGAIKKVKKKQPKK